MKHSGKKEILTKSKLNLDISKIILNLTEISEINKKKINHLQER